MTETSTPKHSFNVSTEEHILMMKQVFKCINYLYNICFKKPILYAVEKKPLPGNEIILFSSQGKLQFAPATKLY